jgi:N-acetyl-alpha-D-muramate 1-phosphate uridylyltransferase
MVSHSLAGVVLAAGAGTRLAPLTRLRPKALCPVANRALVDLAADRLAPATSSVAVNVHHGRDQLEAHLSARGDLHISVEADRALGTAGALAHLRPWLDGRPALVTNADAWLPPSAVDLARFAREWDGERVRLLAVADERSPGRRFGPGTRVVAALHPWADIARFDDDRPAGLYQASWSRQPLDLAWTTAPFLDCGTPSAYLAANLAASGGRSVVGPGAAVEGELVRSVVWPGATVRPGERLVDAVRAGDRITVLVR